MQGVAKYGTEDEPLRIIIEYTPLHTHTLDGTVLRMLIPSGPGDSSYTIELTGRARQPAVDFSFTTDFGPCFVQRGGATVVAADPGSPTKGGKGGETTELIVTNRDMGDCMISTTFQRTPYLDVQLEGAMLEPGGSKSIPIVFAPRDFVEYRERIEFVINEVTKVFVNVRGRGCQLRLELLSMEMQNVDFGVTTGGSQLTRTVKIANRSQRTVDFQIMDPKGDQLREKGVSWNPVVPMSLRPKESCPLDVYFAPQYRIAPFKLPLGALCNLGQEVHLVNVSGVCHATEIKLSEQALMFGAVVLGSTATKKLHLHNFGDLGTKFQFEIPAKVRDVLTITPSDGFVSPHDDMLLSVNFHPTKVMKRDLTVDNIRCLLDSHDPVKLMVTGRCIEQPKDNEANLTFTSEVRKEQVQTFKFPPPPLGKNPTASEWVLRPVVTTKIPDDGSSCFFVQKEIKVPPGGQCDLEIVYKPLTTTRTDADEQPPAEGESPPKGKKYKPESHEGSVFVATPDGQAFVVNLSGKATTAGVSEVPSTEVPCKAAHIKHIPIQNWLHSRQRFHVQVELVDPPPDSDAAKAIKVHGVEQFDLPPDLERNYSVNVYAYKEGAAKVRITFTNDKTGEVMIKEMPFKFTPAQTLSTIKIDAACRQKHTEHMIIANPLATAAKFTCSSTHPDIKFDPEPFEVGPESEGTLNMVFWPLQEGAGEAQVTLTSAELGTYPYVIMYNARPAGVDKTIIFKVSLGGDSVETSRFLHYSSKPASYSASIVAAPGSKLYADSFVVETKDVKATGAGPEGESVAADVRFIPSFLGECRAVLQLTSPDGGNYSALLVGNGIPPQPQGPIVIGTGKSSNVDFRNPFDVATEFSIQVDNPNFSVTSKSQKLDPKKSLQIAVSFKADQEQGARLTISCPSLPTPWTFFLKGTK